MRTLFGLYGLPSPPEPVELVRVRLSYANGTHDARSSWCLEEAGHWILVDGFHRSKSPQDRVEERASVTPGNWRGVHWADTTLLRPESSLGWLSPEGVWFGCAPVWHEVVAQLVFGVSESELHRTYARIREGYFVSPPTSTKQFTSAQTKWLRSHDYGCVSRDEAEYEVSEAARWVAASGRALRIDRISGD
jgi:hypothetical protein